MPCPILRVLGHAIVMEEVDVFTVLHVVQHIEGGEDSLRSILLFLVLAVTVLCNLGGTRGVDSRENVSRNASFWGSSFCSCQKGTFGGEGTSVAGHGSASCDSPSPSTSHTLCQKEGNTWSPTRQWTGGVVPAVEFTDYELKSTELGRTGWPRGAFHHQEVSDRNRKHPWSALCIMAHAVTMTTRRKCLESKMATT